MFLFATKEQGQILKRRRCDLERKRAVVQLVTFLSGTIV